MGKSTFFYLFADTLCSFGRALCLIFAGTGLNVLQWQEGSYDSLWLALTVTLSWCVICDTTRARS